MLPRNVINFATPGETSVEPANTIAPHVAALYVLIGISFLVSIVVPIIGLVISARRRPSLESELYKEYAKVIQLDQMEQRVNRDI
jgi:hypothetical protein